jgi:hypothetical protein
MVLCKQLKSKCYLLKCSRCPGTKAFTSYLSAAFERHDVCENTKIEFNQWVNKDRGNLETFVKTVHEFLVYFKEKLEKLIPHYYISSQQADFIKTTKLSLTESEIMVMCDFSEN